MITLSHVSSGLTRGVQTLTPRAKLENCRRIISPCVGVWDVKAVPSLIINSTRYTRKLRLSKLEGVYNATSVLVMRVSSSFLVNMAIFSRQGSRNGLDFFAAAEQNTVGELDATTSSSKLLQNGAYT